MRKLNRLASAAVAAGALCLGGCDDWLTVPDPTVIDADALDPVADADLLARSAQQNFSSAYGHLIVYSSWFTPSNGMQVVPGAQSVERVPKSRT